MTRTFLIPVLAALLLAGQHTARGQTPQPPSPPPSQKPQEPSETTLPEERPRAPEEPATFLDKVSVTATRSPKDTFNNPRSVTVLDLVDLQQRNARTPVDALDKSIGLWVERRTSTTSDPAIRGVAGRNLLSLIDGNTLSTFWGEGGDGADDMYGKVDPDSIQRIEVIRGPASVLYGSNALGGVLNFITKDPPEGFIESGIRGGLLTKVVYGSNANEWRTRGEVWGTSPRFRFLLGGSVRDIEDMEGGRGQGTLKPTSGNDENWDFKGQFLLRPEQTLTLAVQDIHRTNIHRFYRPRQRNQNDREAAALTWRADGLTGPVEAIETRLYVQDKEERRWDPRWFGYANTRTYSASSYAISPLGSDHRLTYGLHYEATFGENPDDEQWTITEPNGNRYKQAPDSRWTNLGVFVQDEWKAADLLTVTGGARYDGFFFKSHVDGLYQPPGAGYDPERDEFRDKEGALTGGVAGVFHVHDDYNIVSSWSRGYRLAAPNFGLRQLGAGILAPNPFLPPITGDNLELSLRGRPKGIQFALTGYATFFRHFQEFRRGTFMGSDWYDWNGNGRRDPDENVIVQASGEKAHVTGIELEAEARPNDFWKAIPPEWSVRSGFMWNYGRERESGNPLRWTHPARGILAVRWTHPEPKRGFFIEGLADFVRKYDRIAADRVTSDTAWQQDPQNPQGRAGMLRDYGGVPGYTVLDVRAGAKIHPNATLTVAVENLTDKKYRVAHSRVDAPGINFVVGLTVAF